MITDKHSVFKICNHVKKEVTESRDENTGFHQYKLKVHSKGARMNEYFLKIL